MTETCNTAYQIVTTGGLYVTLILLGGFCTLLLLGVVDLISEKRKK